VNYDTKYRDDETWNVCSSNWEQIHLREHFCLQLRAYASLTQRQESSRVYFWRFI
jgi:hypothetical protein